MACPPSSVGALLQAARPSVRSPSPSLVSNLSALDISPSESKWRLRMACELLHPLPGASRCRGRRRTAARSWRHHWTSFTRSPSAHYVLFCFLYFTQLCCICSTLRCFILCFFTLVNLAAIRLQHFASTCFVLPDFVPFHSLCRFVQVCFILHHVAPIVRFDTISHRFIFCLNPAQSHCILLPIVLFAKLSATVFCL